MSQSTRPLKSSGDQDQSPVLQHYLVVMGTSAKPLSSTAGANRTNATTGRSRNSSSPTRTFEASAPGGIFFMKWRSICADQERGNKNKHVKQQMIDDDDDDSHTENKVAIGASPTPTFR